MSLRNRPASHPVMKPIPSWPGPSRAAGQAEAEGPAPQGLAHASTGPALKKASRPNARPSKQRRRNRPWSRRQPTQWMTPPVGWLVVVRGSGQGKVVTIGSGSNSLGRDPGERICIDFGDETISRSGPYHYYL